MSGGQPSKRVVQFAPSVVGDPRCVGGVNRGEGREHLCVQRQPELPARFRVGCRTFQAQLWDGVA